MKAPKIFTHEQVQTHNSITDCWCIIYDKVYDLTSFLPTHPGGISVILKYAGKDATLAFEPIHPPEILSLLPFNACLGVINESLQKPNLVINQKPRPPLSNMLNLSDFEVSSM